MRLDSPGWCEKAEEQCGGETSGRDTRGEKGRVYVGGLKTTDSICVPAAFQGLVVAQCPEVTEGSSLISLSYYFKYTNYTETSSKIRVYKSLPLDPLHITRPSWWSLKTDENMNA